jgi:transcriptional regulator of acetoin/glycerol metabolism
MNLKESEYIEHDTLIKKSWQRCRDSGLNHKSKPSIERLDAGDLSTLLDEHEALIKTTHEEVLPYYENLLVNSNSQVMLADSSGFIMNSWGEQRFKKKHEEIFQTGSGWQERNLGTNAIGTAVKTGGLVQISQDEHFLVANRFMTGSAAPIFGADREMLGVIDISSDTYLPESHTLGMVKIMSQAIENQLIISHFKNQHFLLRFNTSPDNIDSQWSALLVFDEIGTVISANRRAEAVLASNLQLVNISTLFEVNIQQLINQPEGFQIPLLTKQKFRVHGIVYKPQQVKPRILDFRILQKSKKTSPHVSQGHTFELDELDLGDQVMTKAINQSKRIIDKDIPILICGETGAGKEVFVKALHRFSQRHKHNMITVNCAAIPQELVESELFGYEKGAFTGSNTKGYIGLIRKADKGTLFLDEIGDMPMNVQARLLRVLQERRVTPLGSTESYSVDFKLVSATNCHLKESVLDGTFRQDLYYRVSGLNIELPALRDRSDRQQLIQFLLNYYAENTQQALITERVMQAFCQHPWPGNIRQLVSVIKISQAMSDNEVIDFHHLPDDFFSDLDNNHSNVKPFVMTNRNEIESDTHIAKADDGDIISLYQSLSCNISKTAKQLGVSRNTVYKRLRDSGYK